MRPINEDEAEILIEEHHSERGWDITDYNATRKRCRDNAFAAALLMSKPVVVSDWADLARTGKPFLWCVKLLAHHLGVSAEAAMVRIKELNIPWLREQKGVRNHGD